HKEDIPDLVNLFLARFSRDSNKPITGISRDALHLLTDFHWPGNVRELENIIERACALASGPLLEASDIRLDPRRPKQESSAEAFVPEGTTLEQWEDEMIREALRRAGGNKSQAARLLGLSRNALRYRLSKIGIADDSEAES
ncbi:MAG TPA: helix-turn-helix domain-containing protein, partial [Methylomirabilota bacterium]|nr:helix-turn-helix domain-containing protein [Methylomirabilota bacterium]